ncbi:MAG: RagB/SusD family nutrient uptake outer membrane protein [Gemmatirosa sp.]
MRQLRRRAFGACLALGTLGAAGCNLLDVDNPNNVVDSALQDPSAATPLATGAVGLTIRALNAMLDVYGTASDELDFVGSQDGFFQLDVGNVGNPGLQFSDNGYLQMATARYTGDLAVRQLVAFDAQSQLVNRNDLATSYLYAAITYVTIGDMFDDFPIASDRADGAAPVGEAGMSVVYDTAVVYLDRGLAVATATNNVALRTQILAMRARAKYSRALWAKLNPPTRQTGAAQPVASPLVNDAGASADALAALALMGAADFTLTVTPTSTGTAGNNLGNDLNQRREVRIGQAYATPDPAAQGQNRTLVANGQPVIALNDPITGQPDLALRARVNTLINGGQFLPSIIVSAREMHLILAEAALAQGNTAEFTSRVNTVRGFTAGLTPYAGTGVAAQDLLVHMRRVNLFMQGRRLADMYRFGQRDTRWQQTSLAYTVRGCFFPITQTERQSNPNPIPRPLCEG